MADKRAWATIALFATSCGMQETTITLGTQGGEARTFVPLAEGDALPAYMGRQGGFHVYLTARVTGILPGSPEVGPVRCEVASPNPCVDFEVLDLETGQLLDVYVGLRIPLVPDLEGSFEVSPARQVVLDIPALAAVDGHRLRVLGTVRDQTGAQARLALEVVCAPVEPL
jgi:hypothetical protein